MNNLQKIIVCELPFLLWSIEILGSDPPKKTFFVIFENKITIKSGTIGTLHNFY